MPRIFQSRITPSYGCQNKCINNYNNTCVPSNCKNKVNFCDFKNNTLCSLQEVEHFLYTTGKMIECIRLYKKLR